MPRKNRRAPEEFRKTKRKDYPTPNTNSHNDYLSPWQFAGHTEDRNLDSGVDARDTTTGAY